VAAKPRQRPVRQVPRHSIHYARVSPNRHQAISRAKALKSLCHAVQAHTDWDRVLRYLAMFQFHPEELTEAGLSYEVVRAIEARFPLLMDMPAAT